MSIVEKWDAMARKNHALVDAHGTGEKTAVAQAMGAAYLDCLTDLRDACTPRVPRIEWFGTGPNQWDSWWIRVTGGKYGGTVDIVSVVDVYQLHKDSDPWVERDGWCITVDGYFFNNNSIYVDDIKCVPVDREGFPAPVGWHVVGG